MNIIINADVVAIIGACISFGSMLIALTSAIISGHNLKLQKNIYNERKPNLRMNELIESYAIYDDSDNTVKLMFYPLIMNMSSKPTILEKIRLELIGEENTLVLCPSISELYINDGHNIAGNSADTNWICFEVNQDTYKNLKLIKHDLVVEDVFHNSQRVSAIWLKEMVKEK